MIFYLKIHIYSLAKTCCFIYLFFHHFIRCILISLSNNNKGGTSMNNVIIIDPSLEESQSLAIKLNAEIEVETHLANTIKETKEILGTSKQFNVAVVDPMLLDDPQASVVDLLLDNNIPVIIYSSSLKSELLDEIISKPIVDYLIKSLRKSYEVIVNLISNILRHQLTAVLIIDDSKTARAQISSYLGTLKLNIIEASSSNEALIKLKEHPETKLILTDYNMQGGSGIHLTNEIRKTYSNKEISIIGHSAYGNPMLSADFLKHGANDFIIKPFQKEELINRVLIQLDNISYIETLKYDSEKDFLTSIYNRKYIYEVGRKLFSNAKRSNITMACAMIDIDHFKNINDTHGHDVGDKVIIRLAEELSDSFRDSDLVGRVGGEEFCVILTNPDIDTLEDLFDGLRKKIEKIIISGKDTEKNEYSFGFTVSIGVTAVLGESFEELLKFSDMKLYEAKNYGRNMVVL